MDTRDTPEQAELRRAARQLARELGPATVADLDDATRAKRLAAAVRDAGWLELRDDAGDGAPLATRRGGRDRRRRARRRGGRRRVRRARCSPPTSPAGPGSPTTRADGAVVAFAPDLIDAAVAADGDARRRPPTPSTRADEPPTRAYVLVADGRRLPARARARRPTARATAPTSPATVRDVAAGRRGRPDRRPDAALLTADDLAHWTALGLALTSADLVGVHARRARRDRRVRGRAPAVRRAGRLVPGGAAPARRGALVCMEGSLSVALHAAWAVDDLAPADALAAGRVAKAYCARAARTVCETAIQVHGGIGNTWECIAHVYLRRALLSSQWFGDDGAQLPRARSTTRLGVGRWTSVTRPTEAEFRARLRAWLADNNPGCPRRRPTTSTGPARPSGTPRSTTPASSA